MVATRTLTGLSVDPPELRPHDEHRATLSPESPRPPRRPGSRPHTCRPRSGPPIAFLADPIRAAVAWRHPFGATRILALALG
jgi:hypothetical protein